MLRSRHSKRHEHTGENEPTKRKKERSVYFTDGVKDTYQMKPYIAPTAAELEQFLSSLN